MRRVFDLPRDPRELRSISDEFGEASTTVDEVSSGQGTAYEAVFRAVSPEVESRMRELGYLRDAR